MEKTISVKIGEKYLASAEFNIGGEFFGRRNFSRRVFGGIKAGVQRHIASRLSVVPCRVASRRVVSLDYSKSVSRRQSGSVRLSLNISVGSRRVVSVNYANRATSADCDLILAMDTNQKPV